MQKTEVKPKIPESYIKEIQNLTVKCDLTAKQAEQLMKISLKMQVPPERTAATIVLQNYDTPILMESLEKHAKGYPRYKKILDIAKEVSTKVYDGTAREWKIEIKSQYRDLFESLGKKENWFRNKYSSEER